MDRFTSPTRFRRPLAALIATAVLVVGLSNVVYASHPSSVITACVNKSTKAVRISSSFHSQADCNSSESFKKWNVSGPDGSHGRHGCHRCHRRGGHGRWRHRPDRTCRCDRCPRRDGGRRRNRPDRTCRCAPVPQERRVPLVLLVSVLRRSSASRS